ncbi:MAG: hypothetical protein BSOLF_0365 [Candidatus Carbobacillus altaicus]|uniref:YqzE-like protein n=1 Tax=Candidatus Carbonibacillus altaicus TaxID=2163959 RepID=A0A2R6XZ46_9BACL|nr:MAG: hypothetical protein BSOLF_1730 [Candidatus Carbobacillus altaicus]PTQ56330.1 MAG: hypothetical protein BSOLF_0365 [Candidatus Carbobacillus altaicus]
MVMRMNELLFDLARRLTYYTTEDRKRRHLARREARLKRRQNWQYEWFGLVPLGFSMWWKSLKSSFLTHKKGHH